MPGLFTTSRGVMGYGVSNGAAGGISLRGLSGGNARLMVLIDGHPQYAGIFGHPIADAYQTLLADQVEVLHGPASVLYGSNAMGGVINIVTRKMHEDGVHTHLHTGYGSYNTLETELTSRTRQGRFSGILCGSYNRTDGHRENMPFEQYSSYVKLGYELNDNWNTYADVNVTHFNATYPSPASAPLLEGDQHITRGVTSFALKNRYEGWLPPNISSTPELHSRKTAGMYRLDFSTSQDFTLLLPLSQRKISFCGIFALRSVLLNGLVSG